MDMLQASNVANQQNLSALLSPRERKAYRERLRYWSSKGLSNQEAHEKASQLLRSKSNKPIHLSPPQARVDEPSAEEVAAVVKQLKTKRSNSHPSIVNQTSSESEQQTSAQLIEFPAKQVSVTWQTPSAIAPITSWQVSGGEQVSAHDLAGFKQIYKALPLAGSLVMVSAISAILVSASLEVFGYGWQGWLKAILIEVGILYLTLSHTCSTVVWWSKRITALALIGLSFFVLHTGAQKTSFNQKRQVEAGDSELVLLKDRHARLKADYDRLPTNYVTKRAEARSELAQVEQKLSERLADFKSSASVSAIEKTGLAENLLRACLLLMNLFFAHELMGRLRAFRQ